MTRRSINWNEGLAKDLRDREFASKFILASLEEGISLQSTLLTVIQSYGVKEFAKKIDLPSSNLLRALGRDSNPTVKTLNKILKPFRLSLTVSRVDRKRAA